MSGSYNPATKTIGLGPAPSAYQLAHERAHEAQHRSRTLPWRLDQAAAGIPILGRFTRLWVEWEASRLALAVLAACQQRGHRLDLPGARLEAAAGLRSYVRALGWWPGIPIGLAVLGVCWVGRWRP